MGGTTSQASHARHTTCQGNAIVVGSVFVERVEDGMCQGGEAEVGVEVGMIITFQLAYVIDTSYPGLYSTGIMVRGTLFEFQHTKYRRHSGEQ